MRQWLGYSAGVVAENSDIVAQSQERPDRCCGTEVFEVSVEDRLDFLWIHAYALTSFDDHPKVVDCLYVEPRLLDITLELSGVETVYHFFNLVEVGLVTLLVGIDQDVVSVSASEQI
jgi:hypothetical protein